MTSIGDASSHKWPNVVLKDAFQHLHSTMIKGSINVASVADELFANKVLSNEDNHKLSTITDDWERCRRLLALLHCSQHPEAFSHLYGALQREPAYDWLVKKVDELSQNFEEKRSKEVSGFGRRHSLLTRIQTGEIIPKQIEAGEAALSFLRIASLKLHPRFDVPEVANKVLSNEDNHKLSTITDDWERCRRLLALLHCSQHPEAFSHLYGALQREPAYASATLKAEGVEQAIKLVLVGDGATGKTCLLRRFAMAQYSAEYIPTVFDDYQANIIVDQKHIQLGLYDTAGQEDYDRLRPMSYPDTTVFLVCFAIDKPDSVANVSAKWIREIKSHCPKAPVVLVGLKTDMRSKKYADRLKEMGIAVVESAEGRQVAKSIKAIAYVECSALMNEGVDEVFETVTRAVLSPHKKKMRKTKKSCIML